MGKDKKPKTASNPVIGKTPDFNSNLIANKDNMISWHIGSIDLEGNWAWTKIDKNTFVSNILSKFKNFETMKWNDILGRRNHETKVSQICSDAQKRLAEIGKDDTDTLISLSLNGQQRIWGIRYNNILRLIWWDPAHTVYPVKKKHT